jgi:hypothetical protein
MLMGQRHFVLMDFEPSWRLRLFLRRLPTVCFQLIDIENRTFSSRPHCGR